MSNCSYAGGKLAHRENNSYIRHWVDCSTADNSIMNITLNLDIVKHTIIT